MYWGWTGSWATAYLSILWSLPGSWTCLMASSHWRWASSLAWSAFSEAASFTVYFFSPAVLVTNWMTCPEPGVTVVWMGIWRPSARRRSWNSIWTLREGVKSAFNASRVRL